MHRVLAGVAVLACMTTSVHAQQTIVGKWRYTDGICERPADTMFVQPKGILGDTHFCDFDTVKREGNVVTWTGQCGFPEPKEPATVVARQVGNQLFVAYNGGDNGPFVRC